MLFNQTFSLTDIPKVLILIVLECALSVDNALAISLLVKDVPKSLAKRALWIGSFSALILRGASILLVLYLFQVMWLRLLGSLYLVYLAFQQRKHATYLLPRPKRSLWKTVVLIETTDAVFALDSILAALGFMGAQVNFSLNHPKLWIIYVGGIAGIAAMRFMASKLISFTRKHPKILDYAHWLLGWIGFKLSISAILAILYHHLYYSWTIGVSHYIEPIFWIGFALISFYILLKIRKKLP